jgi:GNAT superfamily N-acetyltransferase
MRGINMNGSIRIVKNDEDIQTTVRLAREIWTQHYLPIIGREQVDYMLLKYQSYEAIGRQIAEGYVYYLAYDGDIPCGYSSIKEDRGVFLSKFYVKDSFRGRGMGKAMIGTIQDYAKEKRLGRIWLTCNKYNSRSLEIYKKLGFSIINSIVTDIGNGFVMDDYVLEKTL